jgi:uncharacterized protein (UPF0332 family)
MDSQYEEVALYIQNADEMLKVACVMLDNDFYTSAINRAYYAIFYAASALLITKGMGQSKHSQVISAFRLHFIKTGLLGVELSQIYGRAMEDRHESDYELDAPITKEDAEANLEGAQQFVQDVKKWLKQENWL